MQTQHPQSASPQSTHTQFSPAQFSPTNSPAIRTGLIIGLITFAALTAGVGFGCASHTPKHDSSTIGVFDAIYPRQTQPLKAESLWPIQPQQTRYARASKINGQDTDIGIYKITQNDDHIFVITLENSHESHLKINDDGSYAITRETDHKQNVTVTYDPALIILPASLTPDKPVTQTVHMTVYQRDTDHIRDQGICTNTIQLLADPPQKDHREMSRGVAYLDQKNSPPPTPPSPTPWRSSNKIGRLISNLPTSWSTSKQVISPNTARAWKSSTSKPRP